MRIIEIETLQEAVFELDQDVDMIYDKAFDHIIQAIQNNIWDGFYNPPELLGTSAILVSPECKQAHKINPIKIITSKKGNFYSPQGEYISVSMNMQALDLLKMFIGNPDPMGDAIEQLPMNQHKRFKTEFTSHRVKGSIHHELSHWLDDTLHNSHIRNRLQTAHELPNKVATKHFNQGEEHVDLSKFEMNAQLHAIMQIRKDDLEMWNLYSFEEMIQQNASLYYLSDEFKKIGKYEQWKKYLLKRLAREHLLGQEMHRT